MENVLIEAFGVKNDPSYAQCPRCRNYGSLSNGVGNFDNLCDRCCRVLINCFPEHSSVKDIILYERSKNGQSPDGVDKFIDQLKMLKALNQNNDVFETDPARLFGEQNEKKS